MSFQTQNIFNYHLVEKLVDNFPQPSFGQIEAVCLLALCSQTSTTIVRVVKHTENKLKERLVVDKAVQAIFDGGLEHRIHMAKIELFVESEEDLVVVHQRCHNIRRRPWQLLEVLLRKLLVTRFIQGLDLGGVVALEELLMKINHVFFHFVWKRV